MAERLDEEPYLLEAPVNGDARGKFSKPLHVGALHDACFEVREIFWSTSSTGVIRGIHFQTPPRQLAKLVWVSQGSLFDVVVDLRKGATFGRVTTFGLDSVSGHTLWVPPGFGHGFQALEDETIVNYATDGFYSPEHDVGIAWDSIDLDWPLPVSVVSNRDLNFEGLHDFDTPF
jgi:dTDP-4-dehydrorhamnose 3,5-epimerase